MKCLGALSRITSQRKTLNNQFFLVPALGHLCGGSSRTGRKMETPSGFISRSISARVMQRLGVQSRFKSQIQDQKSVVLGKSGDLDGCVGIQKKMCTRRRYHVLMFFSPRETGLCILDVPTLSLNLLLQLKIFFCF